MVIPTTANRCASLRRRWFESSTGRYPVHNVGGEVNGHVAERSNAADCRSAGDFSSVGSNPTMSFPEREKMVQWVVWCAKRS